MSAQSGTGTKNSADSQQTGQKDSAATIFASVRSYARGHRNVMAIVTVSAITAAVIVPYVATAGVENFGNIITGQPLASESQTVKDVTDMDQQKRETLQQTTSNSSNKNQTNVTVNGQQVPLSDNGTYHQKIDDGNNHMEVKVESKQSSSGNSSSNSNNSSVHFNVQTESHSSSEPSD